mgnify:CR=1 FL=1
MNKLRYEIDVLRKLNHPNIVNYYDFYEDEKYIHIVMEYCSGGDMLDRLISKTYYEEAEAAILVYKIIGAVNFLHNHGIVHRDIKPENFIFESEDPHSDIKLIDFGLSRKF